MEVIALLTKICKRCGELFPYGPGAYCEKCRAAMPSRHKAYDEKVRDQKAAAFYRSAQWIKLRNLAMQRAGGLCEACRRHGQVVPADEVHHKVPISEDWSRRLDPSNLICLCKSCHRTEHERMKRGRWVADKGQGSQKSMNRRALSRARSSFP